MTAKGNRNATLAKLDKQNAELRAALADLLDYVEDCGIGVNGKLTRQAESASQKARKLLGKP
jgi:hypothetical protein